MESKYINKDNAANYVGKTIDVVRRARHYYPLTICKMSSGEYGYIDRNGVLMPLNNERLYYDIITSK